MNSKQMGSGALTSSNKAKSRAALVKQTKAPSFPGKNSINSLELVYRL